MSSESRDTKKGVIVLRASIALNILLTTAVLVACIWKFTNLRYAIQDVVGEGYSYELNNWYEPYTYQTRELSDVRSCDICFAGDSLTMYGLWDEFWSDLVIANRGIGSDTSEGLLARIDTIVSCSPRKVFVMIGTNDVSRGLLRGETVANVRDTLEGICEGLPEAEVYLQSVLPRTSEYATAIEELNADYAVLCGELTSQGLDVTWIDLYPSFVEEGSPVSELFVLDGYHMSGRGYQLWSESIESYVYG